MIKSYFANLLNPVPANSAAFKIVGIVAGFSTESKYALMTGNIIPWRVCDLASIRPKMESILSVSFGQEMVQGLKTRLTKV